MKKDTDANVKYYAASGKTALSIMIPVALAALCLAGAVISVANDMYAFVKPDRELTFTVTRSLSGAELSKSLRESGIIRNDAVFSLYLKVKGKTDDVALLSGEWKLNSSMSYRQLLIELF